MCVPKEYASNLLNEQWRLIKKVLPEPKKRCRKPIDRRQVINAILYWNRTECQWRYLPGCFPNWSTVYGVFRGWRIDGTWQRIHGQLREWVRTSEGKKPTPTVAIIDSQSVKTAEGGEQRDYDAGKKITGRKRHIAVDTLGLLLVVVVHAASLQDYEGAHFVPHRIKAKFRRLKLYSPIVPTADVGCRIGCNPPAASCFKPSSVRSTQRALWCCQNDGLWNGHLHG